MIPTSRNNRNRRESSGKITVSGRKSIENRKSTAARNTASMKSPEFPGTNRFFVVLSDLSMRMCVLLEYSLTYVVIESVCLYYTDLSIKKVTPKISYRMSDL